MRRTKARAEPPSDEAPGKGEEQTGQRRNILVGETGEALRQNTLQEEIKFSI